MYKIPQRTASTIDLNTSIEGETIEQEIERLINDGAPVEAGKEMTYTKPSEGVKYGTDIRGDKWDNAIEINEKINESIDKIRENKLKVVKDEDEKNTSGDDEKGNGDTKKDSI